MTAAGLGFHEVIRTGNVEARLVCADWPEEHGRLEASAMLRSGRWCLVPASSCWMGGAGDAGDKRLEAPHCFYLGAYPD